MSELQLPGQVGIGVIHVPGNNANAVATTLQAGPNQIQICVAGGLTKRQELAARFLAAILSGNVKTKGVFDPNVPEVVDSVSNALIFADALVVATEPAAG